MITKEEIVEDEIKHTILISRKEKPNTFEIGKAGHRHTIAYDKPEDLELTIKSLRSLGYLRDEDLE